jgi:hypothetical protein
LGLHRTRAHVLVAALSLLAFMLIIMLRRRRLRQVNESYVTQPGQHHQGPYQPYQPPQHPPQPSYDPSVSRSDLSTALCSVSTPSTNNGTRVISPALGTRGKLFSFAVARCQRFTSAYDRAPVNNYPPHTQSQQYPPVSILFPVSAFANFS